MTTRKYVFDVRSDPVNGPKVESMLDVTALAEMQSKENLEQFCAVTKRVDPDDKTGEKLTAELTWLAYHTGQYGELRRRLNNNIVGPLIVTWEDDEELTHEMLDAYLQAMKPERRAKFYKEARF